MLADSAIMQRHWTIDTIKQLFKGESLSFMGKLHSPEHNQSFSVQDAKLQLFKEGKDSDRLKPSINGQNIIDWFKEQFGKLRLTVRPHIKPPVKMEIGNSKGIKK